MILATFLRSQIRKGSLVLVDTANRRCHVGDVSSPRVVIRLPPMRAQSGLLLNPRLWLGQAYTDGTLIVEDGQIYDFLELLARNYPPHSSSVLSRTLSRLRALLPENNGPSASRRNIGRHYDLCSELYELFLDSDLQYSCAYFRSDDDSLDTAQHNKKFHLAKKLLLSENALSVLDIGSGWGGLGIFLAQFAGVEVTGITLSGEQLTKSRARAVAAGVSDTVHFYLRDYREENGRYDRIVSVGMLEHVGKRNYGRYFGKIAEILKDDGIGLVQTIGYADEPGPIDPFIRRFVFPGAAIPTLSELFQAIERSGLWVTDVEVLRLHYAETLRHWRERWAGARDRVLLLYGDKFYRMWEYYLALCEIGFRWRSNVVFQIQLAKRQTAVPITRDYIYASESRPSGEVQAEARQLATDEWTAITASNR